jgi:hypothetical protein
VNDDRLDVELAACWMRSAISPRLASGSSNNWPVFRDHHDEGRSANSVDQRAAAELRGESLI